MVPPNIIKPIRHVVTLAVDNQHLKRPAPSPSGPTLPVEPVEFCVIKRQAIAMYSLKERLFYQKVSLSLPYLKPNRTCMDTDDTTDQEIPLPQGASLARRTGRSLCICDSQTYNMVDLETASLIPLLPLSQAMDPTPFVVKPSITVISDNEFLILSWTGASTLGLFISGDGDPVRGTLEWPSHPEAVCASSRVLLLVFTVC